MPLKIEPTTELGRFIRAKRLELGLTQIELAKQAGITCATISNIETGTSLFLTANVSKKLCRVFPCEPEELNRFFSEKKKQLRASLKPLGRFIREHRERLGISIAELARQTKLDHHHLQVLETYRQFIDPSTMEPLSLILGCKTQELEQFLKPKRLVQVVSPSTSPLGKHIQDRRVELNRTLEDVGRAIHVSRERIRQLEKNGKVPLHLLRKLAETLELDFDELLQLIPKKQRRASPKKLAQASPLVRWFIDERISRGWTLQEAATAMGYLHAPLMSWFESGHKKLSRTFVEAYAKALGMEIPDALQSSIVEDGKHGKTGKKINDDLGTTPLLLTDQTHGSLGERIRFFRTLNNLSQMDLAKKIGISQVQISSCERGIHVPNAKTISRIEAVIGSATGKPQTVSVVRYRREDPQKNIDALIELQEQGRWIEVKLVTGEKRIIVIV